MPNLDMKKTFLAEFEGISDNAYVIGYGSLEEAKKAIENFTGEEVISICEVNPTAPYR